MAIHADMKTTVIYFDKLMFSMLIRINFFMSVISIKMESMQNR